MQKRIFCLFLTFVMILSLLPMPARAAVGSEEIGNVIIGTEPPPTTEPQVVIRPINTMPTDPPETEPPVTEPPETEPAEVPAFREQNGNWYFSNFSGLKALSLDTYDYGTCFYYEGEGPLVIREDLVIPGKVEMMLEEATVIVPQGVTLSTYASEFCSLDVGTLLVEGTVELGRFSVVWIYEALTVTGTLKTSSTVSLWQDAALTGQGNIQTQGAEGYLFRELFLDTMEDFLSAVRTAAQDYSGMYYGISWYSEGSHTLTDSLTVPENVELNLDVPQLTVPQGVTLELNCETGCTIRCDMTVAGQLINNTEEIDYYGKLTFTPTGSYAATGSLALWADSPEETLEQHLTGLDLSNFTARWEADPTFDIYLWNITPGASAPEEDTNQLNAPMNLSFDSKGQLSWTLSDARPGILRIEYYLDGLSIPVGSMELAMASGQSGSDYMLSYLEPVSGTYYAVAQYLPTAENEGTYRPSDAMTSPPFVYQVPGSSYAAPGDLTWDTWPNFHWSHPAGHTQGFVVALYYAASATQTPVQISWEPVSGANHAVPEWMIREYGDGCYYFRVSAVSEDITQVATGPWSDLSDAYIHGNVAEEGVIASGAYGRQNWVLTESGHLMVSGTGSIPDCYDTDSPWYVYREQIKAITVEEGITGIGAYAFVDLPNVTSLSLPSTLTALGDYAFSYAVRLESVSLPASLTDMGANPFACGFKLREITVEAGSPFFVRGNVLFWQQGEDVTLVCYPGGLEAPTYILPQDVTLVHDGAFYEVANLEDVTLPANLKEIGSYAFGNSSIRSITLPRKLEYIGYYAFEDCEDLMTVRFLGDPPVIEASAFTNVVADAYYPDGNNNWSIWDLQGYGGLLLWLSDDGGASDIASGTSYEIAWRITGDGMLVLYGDGSVGEYSQSNPAPWYAYRDQITGIRVQDGVTMLGAFSMQGLYKATWLELPESLLDIGNYAFLSCTGLTSVHIPSRVYSTGFNPFAYCSSLTQITVEPGSEYYYTENGVLFYKSEEDGEYTLCSYPAAKTDSDYRVPEGTTDIFGAAFLGAERLTRVDLPEGLEYIYDSAFARSRITEIRFPASLTYIGKEAFLDCAQLSAVHFSGETAPKIENMAFWNVSAEVSYPAEGNWDTVVGQNYGGTLTWVSENTVIAQGTSGDTEWYLTSDGTLTICGQGSTGDYQDSDAPWYAYRDQVTRIDVCQGVTGIGIYAFFGMSKVTEVNLPEGLHEVLSYAFWNCDSLETVTIPASMTNIGYNPFAAADNLKKIIVAEGNPVFYTVEDVLFYHNPQQGYVYLCSYPGAKQGTSYRIPEGTMEIFGGAFLFNYHLQQVTLPESLLKISPNGFAYSSLTEITIPEGLKTLGNSVFAYSKDLKTVTFQGCPETIGETAFAEVAADVWYYDALWPVEMRTGYGGNLTWNPIQTGTIAEGITGQVSWKLTTDGTLVIYGQGQTEDCWDHYPEFYQYRDQITGIVIEEGVTYVGAYLFDGLYRTAKLQLPQGLEYIATAAFLNCDSISRITVPASVTVMDANPFAGIEALTEIRVEEGNPNFRSVDGVLFSGSTLVAYPGGKTGSAYTVPDGTQEIGVAAFFGNTTLSQVNLPEGLLAILGNAFEEAAIPEVTIPASVVAIYGFAFGQCASLNKVTFLGSAPGFGGNAFQDVTATCYYPANDPSWTSDVLQSYNGNLTWLSAGTQESLVATGYVGDLSWKLTDSGTLVIYGTGSTGDFPDSYPTYYQYEDQITAIRVEEGVTELGSFAFFELPNVKTLRLPDSLQFIGTAAFLDCGQLQTVHIGAGLQDMDINPFCGLPTLKSFTVASGNPYYSVIDGVLFRDNGQTLVAYPGGKAGSTYTLPQQTRSIGDGAFYGNTGLTQVNLPEGLTAIKSYAFDLSNVESILLPASLEEIGLYAFAGCTNLNSITFRGGAPFIHEYAFADVVADVYYPASQSSWTGDKRVNYGGDLTWHANTQDIASGITGDIRWRITADGTMIFFGQGATDDYADSDAPWTAYESQITSVIVEEGVTALGDYCCFNMANATGVQLPETLTYLGANAFYGCSSLESITLPASLVDFGGFMFTKCTSLKEILVAEGNPIFYSRDGVVFGEEYADDVLMTMLCFYPEGKSDTTYQVPADVDAILDGAFLFNKHLRHVTMPDSLMYIGSYAFESSALETVELSDGLTYIANSAFVGCENLTEITIPAGVNTIDNYAFADTGLQTVRFLGNAPAFGKDVFENVTANVYYPPDNATWTQAVRQNYGGSLTWQADIQDIASGVTGEVSWRITNDGTMIFFGQGATDDYADSDAPWTAYESQITSVIVEEGVTALGDYCCFNMANATGVQLPETLTYLGANAFYGCSSLESITLPASLVDFGGFMFSRCTSLKEILVAEGNPLLYSRDGVVYGRESVEDMLLDMLCFYPEGKTGSSFTVPSDVNVILDGAFLYNKHLHHVTMSDTVMYIGSYAFEDTALETLELSDGLVYISNSAFVTCENLTEITIPAGVSSIGNYAFADTGLKTVRFLGDAPFFGEGVFENVTADVYYPQGNSTWTRDVMGNYGGRLNWISGGGIDIYGEDTVLGGKSIKITGFLKPYGGDILWSVSEEDGEIVTLKASGNSVTVTAADVTELRTITLIASAEDGSSTAEFRITVQPKVKALKIYERWYDENGDEQWQDMSLYDWWYITLDDSNRGGFDSQLEAVCLPEGSEEEITWSSSNTKVATIDAWGRVHYTGKAGTTVFTAKTESGVKVSYTQKVIDPVIHVEAVGNTQLSLMGGKSTTLKVRNAETGKNITGKNVEWTLWMEDGDPSAFASINSSGKLTTKKVVEEVTFQVYADVLTDGVYTGYVCYDVTLYPATTHVELLHGEEVVNGTTLSFNTNIKNNQLAIGANVLPEDAMPGELLWTHNDAKGAYAEVGLLPDGRVLIYNATGKAGTMTITAKAQDGSNKSASVKVQFGRFADSVDIWLEDTVLYSGKSMKLEAEVYPTNVTKSGVTWSLADPADKAYVTLSGSKLTAKNVYSEHTVTLIATSKDGKASASCEVTVLPKDLGMLSIYDSATDTNVTKSTITVDLNRQNREVYLRAVNFYDGSQADVEWKYKSSANAQIYESGGILVVKMLKAGSVNITAKDGSRTATVTVKAAKLTNSVTVTTKNGGNLIQDGSGRTNVQVASGKSVDLKAILSGGSGSRVTWSIVSGSRYGKLSASGKFTAAKNVSSVQEVVVRATAADGSGVWGETTVLVKPLATGIKIYTLEADSRSQTLSLFSGNGSVTRSNTNLVWDMQSDGGFRIYANVYPYYANAQWRSAMQDVTWKSSAPKVASIDKNGNVLCLKPGTTTITATAADGSGQKISFKLTVVKQMTGLSFPETGVVGGKSITLKPIFEPSDVTNKKLSWEISGDTAFAKIDQKGKLTTKKVTQVKTVTVTARAQDGSNVVAQVEVKIWPKAAKSVTLVSNGYNITGDTLTLRQGQSLAVEALVNPGSACPDVTWKVSEEGYVTVENGLITAVKSGKTITVTATANDGSGKKATVKITTVR